MARGQLSKRLAQLARAAWARPSAAPSSSSPSPCHTHGPSGACCGGGRATSTSTTSQQQRCAAAATATAAADALGQQPGQAPARRHSALAAPEEAPQRAVVHQVRTDLYGAVSMVAPGEGGPASQQQAPQAYRNVDGQRFEDGRYQAFAAEVSGFIPKERQYTDPVRTFAYGTDASFYRLNPKMVIKIHSEAEVRQILPIARKHQVPVTFRAAGTSLSGQAITDSVLLKLSHTGRNFRNYEVHVSCR